MSGVLEPLSVAQREIEAACALLIDPSAENLDRCSVFLGDAVSRLTDTKPSGDEALALRASVHRVRRLLETAAVYHRQWQAILRNMMAGGYTSQGDLAAPSVPGRFWMAG